MKLIIHCAMKEESEIFADWLGIPKDNIKEHTAIHSSKEEVILWTSGIGPDNVITSYKQLIEVLHPEPSQEYLIINVGYAGSPNKLIGDDVLITKVYNFNFSIPGYEDFEIPKEDLTPVLVKLNNITHGICYSSNYFVGKKDLDGKKIDIKEQPVLFDMELKTLSDLCKVFMFPLVSIKLVSDNLGFDEYKSSTKGTALADGRNRVLSHVKLLHEETKDIKGRAPVPDKEGY